MSNRKVNLSDIRHTLIKRGKAPYENAELQQDIENLDPNDPEDAFVWSEAFVPVDLPKDKLQAERMKYRNRADIISDKAGVKGRISWTSEGEMVISRK
jgi:hypothetical protein